MPTCYASSFSTENKSSDCVGVTSAVYNRKKKKKKRTQTWVFTYSSLIPLISLTLLVRDMVYMYTGSYSFVVVVFYFIFLPKFVWSSFCCLSVNILPGVLPVIPLVGYGKTACAVNLPTLKQENWCELTHRVQSARGEKWYVLSQMLLVLSRMR